MAGGIFAQDKEDDIFEDEESVFEDEPLDTDNPPTSIAQEDRAQAPKPPPPMEVIQPSPTAPPGSKPAPQVRVQPNQILSIESPSPDGRTKTTLVARAFNGRPLERWRPPTPQESVVVAKYARRLLGETPIPPPFSNTKWFLLAGGVAVVGGLLAYLWQQGIWPFQPKEPARLGEPDEPDEPESPDGPEGPDEPEEEEYEEPVLEV